MSHPSIPRRPERSAAHAPFEGRFTATIRWALSLGATLALAAGCGIGAPRVPSLAAWDDLERSPVSAEPDEMTLWKKSRTELDAFKESKAGFEDAALEAYLAEIVTRLAPPIAAGGPKFQILVMADVERNAFALPDGTLVIALPLLASFDNEAQLAFVLAHEIAHVTKRHTLLASRYDAMTSSHVERMRLSRRTESEADRVATRLMLAAGYDPGEAIPALRHVHETAPSDGERVRAWSSHEDLPFRLAELRPAIALLRSRGTEVHAERFQRAMDGCRLQAAVLELDAERFDIALGLVNHQLARLPRSGAAYTLRARIRRAQSPEERFSKAVREDLERGVEYAPDDADTLRALGLFLRDTGEIERSNALLRRYLAARPEAFDRKIVERYIAEPTP